MDAVSPAALSAVAINRVLEMATQSVIKQAEKMVKVAVEMAVGREAGKGENLDVCA